MLKRSVNCKSLFAYRFLLPFQFLGRDSLLQLHFHILASGSTPIFSKCFLSFCLHVRSLCLLRLCPPQGLRGAGWGSDFARSPLPGLATSLLILSSSWPREAGAFLCLPHCTHCVNFTSRLGSEESLVLLSWTLQNIHFILLGNPLCCSSTKAKGRLGKEGAVWGSFLLMRLLIRLHTYSKHLYWLVLWEELKVSNIKHSEHWDSILKENSRQSCVFLFDTVMCVWLWLVLFSHLHPTWVVMFF